MLFVSFVCGVLTEEFFSSRLRAFFLPVEPHGFLTVVFCHLILSLFFSFSLPGSYLMLPLSFSFGLFVSFISRLIWSGELLTGQQTCFFLYSVFFLPAFFLVCMQGIQASLLLQKTARHAGTAWKEEFIDSVFVGIGILVSLAGVLWILYKVQSP